MQAGGDAVVAIAADLQDPPELIPEFLRLWGAGAEVVLGQKKNSAEPAVVFGASQGVLPDGEAPRGRRPPRGRTGFGLYSRKVIEDLRALDEPYPYVRGLVSELGYAIARLPYDEPVRERGASKNNLYTLYDVAMLGITNHSKVP